MRVPQIFMRNNRVIKIACMISCLITSWLMLETAAAQSMNDTEQYSRIIIKWKQHTTHTHTQSIEAADNDMRRAVGTPLYHRRGISETMDGMQLQRPLTRANFVKALAKLNTNPDVEFAVEDKKRFPHALTNDPLITASSNRTGQWYLNDPAANSQWVSAINAITAWDYSTGGAAGSGVIVAVVDTGIRPDHPDLAGKLLPGRDFVNCDEPTCSGSGLTYLTANDGDGWDSDPSDPGDWVSSEDKATHPSVFVSSCDTGDSSWHGTRVAGIIGAGTNNGIGIAGIGYNARILPVRALGKCGGYDSDIMAGMRWAAGLHVSGVPDNPNPAKVINLSLGSAGTCDQTYTTTVSEIRAAGVSIVASAGNDSAATNTPANCPGVIGVVAVRNVGSKVGFSSLGPEITIAAPGGNCGNGSGPCLFSIDTTTNLGTVDQTQTCPVTGNSTAKCRTTPGVNDYTDQLNPNLGTSFSAPIVSGTIALMLGSNPSLTPTTITNQLKATATAFPQPELDTNNQPISCVSPTATNASTINSAPCNCTTNLCGAGMVNALKAVLSVAPPTITISGSPTVAVGGTDDLSASNSTAAITSNTLSYTWSIVSGGGSLSATNTASTTVTAPNVDATVVVRVTATDNSSLHNSASKDFTITVGAGGSSSSSSASSSSTSSTSSSSNSIAASSASTTVTGATKGGGAWNSEWLFGLLLLTLLRTQHARLRRYF